MIDVAIVGAGAAGMGAARMLARAGCEVLVLEAGARIGGRARTEHVRGLPLDQGCGWLHSADRNPWVRIAGTHRLTIDRSSPAWGTQWRGLGFPADEQRAANAAADAFDRRLRDAPPASDRAADALSPGDRWNPYLDARSGYVNGVELAALSVADYLAYEDAATETNWRLPAGYGTLVARAMPPVATAVATPVRAVREVDGGVALDTDAGTVRARCTIVTVPTTVLSRGGLRLPPALDDHAHAASRLPLGLANKLFLTLAEGVADGADHHLIGRPDRACTGSYYLRPFGRPVVECFFGGACAAALEDEGPEAAAAFARAELSALLGSEAVRGMAYLAGSAWGSDERFGGSYSHALPGHAAARTTLARPWHDRIFFAGEACSRRDFSTAHGAYGTGVGAAKHAVRALR